MLQPLFEVFGVYYRLNSNRNIVERQIIPEVTFDVETVHHANKTHSVPRDRLLRQCRLIRRLVGHPAVHPGVPWVEEELLLLRPRAVALAELEAGHAHQPVGGGAEHAHLNERSYLIVYQNSELKKMYLL